LRHHDRRPGAPGQPAASPRPRALRGEAGEAGRGTGARDPWARFRARHRRQPAGGPFLVLSQGSFWHNRHLNGHDGGVPVQMKQKIRYVKTSDGIAIAWARSGQGRTLVRASNWLTHLEYDWQSLVWRHWT